MITKGKKMAYKTFTNIFDAARRGTVEDVKYFVEKKGADISVEDADGWTPLDIAKGRTDSKGNADVVRYLNCAMAKNDTYYDAMRTRPFTKVEQAEIDCFCKAYGNDVHALDKSGEPFMLHEAAAYWDVAVVLHLIRQGADVHAINQGFTPLMSAIAENADIEVINCLYIESVRMKFRPEGDPTDDLIAFAKEMRNTDAVKYLTGWVDIIKSMQMPKEPIMKLLDTIVNAEPDSGIGEYWRESGGGLLKSLETILSYSVELTPEEIDLYRRAKDEL